VYRQRYSLCGVLQLRPFAFRQRGGHEERKRTRAERIARRPLLHHFRVFGCVVVGEGTVLESRLCIYIVRFVVDKMLCWG
jgi:hypothetical protein